MYMCTMYVCVYSVYAFIVQVQCMIHVYTCMYMYFCFFSRQKSAKVKTKYSTEYFAIDGDADIQMTGPVFRGATVFL